SLLVISLLWLGLWRMDLAPAQGGVLLPAANPDAMDTGTPPATAPSHTPLAKGVLLIAGKDLADPNFSRAVVLITEYSDQGTTGLVLNKRTSVSASRLLPQLENLSAHLDAIHIGGPVAVNHINLLVKSGNAPQGAQLVVDNIFVVNSMTTLKQLEEENKNGDNIRVYMGFAGWAPGQLETELLRGDWHIWPASSAIIFSETPENIWYELIYLATAKWT
ncbi:MAG: YqgE/AlgH family protein, partial [Gammaproteobacteria bacterium]